VLGFVQSAAAAIGCDASFIALPTLAALASAIGTTRRLELKPGWAEPAILWMAVVAESGDLKSPAMDTALWPLYKLQERAIKAYAEKVTEHRREKLNYKKRLAAWERIKGDSSPPDEPKVPICERLYCDDSTVEAIAPLLQARLRGLLMKRDELSAWFGSFDRYASSKSGKGSDAAKWIEMFGGRPLVIDRKTTGTIFIPRAALCVCGGIQPGVLRRAIGQEHKENGMLARLLLAMPPRNRRKWTECKVDPAMMRKMLELFEHLLALNATIDEDGDYSSLNIKLGKKAKSHWIEFYNAHAEEHVELTGDLAACWSKLEGYAARLALVIHCVRQVAGDPNLAYAEVADVMSIEAGIKLSNWFGGEAKRVYAVLGETHDEQVQRDLVELIRRKGGLATPRELQRWRDRQFPTSDAAETGLRSLVSAGYGRFNTDIPGPTGGRPAFRFTLTDTDTTSESQPKIVVPSVSAPKNAVQCLAQEVFESNNHETT
jgi:hypothetical protein